jgi:hypothetical protein
MRRLILLAGLALAVGVLLPAGALPAAGGSELPFKGYTSGVAQAEGHSGDALRFHSEVTILNFEQVPVPAGRCTEPLPPGLSYLWLTKATGTATSTHLGTGPYYIELCVYGLLTNPAVPPPGNGIPMGWLTDVEIWTAANGDQLLGTGELIGFTAPPPTPGFQFIESLTFLDGGTGRFAFAEGTGQGIIDPVTGAAVYDGWIRYGKKGKSASETAD